MATLLRDFSHSEKLSEMKSLLEIQENRSFMSDLLTYHCHLDWHPHSQITRSFNNNKKVLFVLKVIPDMWYVMHITKMIMLLLFWIKKSEFLCTLPSSLCSCIFSKMEHNGMRSFLKLLKLKKNCPMKFTNNVWVKS